MTYDLILRGGRVIDPSQNLDASDGCRLRRRQGRPRGPELQAGAGTAVRDVSGKIVTPGLIDLHTHVYWGGTSLGIDAEEFCRTSGVTTADRHRQRRSRQFRRLPQARDRAEPGAHPRLPARVACRHLRLLRPRHGRRERRAATDGPISAVEVADANRDVIVGIKVRVGRGASGNSGTVPLDIALQVPTKPACR